ncbi:MAG: Ig-like domain-containing protein [Promethearchaeota archaeon]
MKKKFFVIIVIFGLLGSIYTVSSLTTNFPTFLLQNEGQYQVNTIPFNWIDITSTGTHLTLIDDDYEMVSFPFNFPFYEESFSSILISSNGFFTFDTTTSPTDTYENIPQTYFPFLVALLWTDLYPDDGYGGGGVYYQAFGDYIVIQYDYISTCCMGNLAGNFEAILYSSGAIQMFYDEMNMTELDTYDYTIGVDRGDNVNYTIYSGLIDGGLGIEFSSNGVSSEKQYLVKDTPFNWYDITTTGIHLSLDDDSYQTVSLPFIFPFYDEKFSEVSISSNGFLTFDTNTYATKTYGEIPQGEYPYLIALFWTDLYPDDGYGGGGVYYQAFGDYFVVQYDNISTCCSGDLAGNFEIILYPSGIIQMYYLNLAITDGVIGVDTGDSVNYTTYSLIHPVEELGIEFSPRPGVSIISTPYYVEEETTYTLEWSPMGVMDVSYYEVLVDGISQGTTTDQSMIIPVSSPESYNVTVVLYTTDSSFGDQIKLEAIQPIVNGLYVGAYLTYKFEDIFEEGENQYMIYHIEVIERISTYLWLMNISTSLYEDDTSIEPIETYNSTEELDTAFLSSKPLFWSNAHQKSLGDTIKGLSGTATITGEKTIYIPEMDFSFKCWEVEMPMGEEEAGFAYFCKITGVVIALESSNYIHGRLIDFDYPFIPFNAPPSLRIQEPDEGDTFNTGTIEVEVTTSDDKPGLAVEVKLDDGPWEEMTEVREDRWEYSFEDVSEGEHEISVRATDSEGLQVTESVSFEVGEIETSETDGAPLISPGFEIIFPMIGLVLLFFSKKRRK